jgi:CHASE3 domain sensor protein
LMQYAPWVDWAVMQNVPKAQLNATCAPDSAALEKATECLEASKAVCISMETLYKGVQAQGILRQPDAGSIPAIMATAMQKVQQLQTEHIQPIQDIIYSHDGKTASVKEVKQMLAAAAQTVQALTQTMGEAKALVNKYKSAAAGKPQQRNRGDML